MSSSPIHVHVQDNTPLHVHVKKPKKSEIREVPNASDFSPGNVRHSVRQGPRGKLKPTRDPWIPAPGRTSMKDKLDKNYKWESTGSQLEVNPPKINVSIHGEDEPALRTGDLTTEEDILLRSHLSAYEKKIEGLMAEVGTLKNQTEHLNELIQHRNEVIGGNQTICRIKQGFSDLSHDSSQTEFYASDSDREIADIFGEDAVPRPHKIPLYHVACFKRPEERYYSCEQAEKVLDKMVKRAAKGKSAKMQFKSEKAANRKNSDKTSAKKEPVVFVNSSRANDFESKGTTDNLEHETPKAQAVIRLKKFGRPSSEKAEIQQTENFNKVSFKQAAEDQSSLAPEADAEEEVAKQLSSICLLDEILMCSTPRTCMQRKKMEDEIGMREVALEASHAALREKQNELNYVAKEFEESERENQRLRKSVGNYQSDLVASMKELENLPDSKETLLHQLVEVEVNGAEAGKQVAALRDVMSRLKYEKRLALSDVKLLSKQRDLLLEKLEEFEKSNRNVRRLLQVEHKTMTDVKRLEEQRDILMRKLTDSDSDILRMRSELIQKRTDLEALTAQVNEEKNHAHTLNELNKSVETTRAHLQRELRTKEMENNRLHVRLKNMERDSELVRREAEELTLAARSERETLAREKDGLKKATRAQRNRAEKAEDAVKVMEEKLADRERKLEEARSQADAWRDRFHRTSDEKCRLDDHVQSLAEKLTDVESTLRSNELLTQTREEDLRQKLDRIISENAACRSDAEKYKSEALLAEERARREHDDAMKLKSDVRQLENVETDLRAQLRKAKNELEEALLSAERVERSSRRLREDGTSEIERVKEQMLNRMKDLQPLPELLKETEMKLQDAQDRLHVYEQRSAEQTRIIAEMTNKGENCADETSLLRQKLAALSDENRGLEARLQILQVKMDDKDVRAKENMLDTVSKDEKIQQLQLKVEEANHEKTSFKRQLESAVADNRKAVEAEVDKAAAREHAAQARIVDLETQLTRLKTDVASAKRAKEDCDRRSRSSLQDARDRLEQAESTNRSMRNYISFLKSSYNNVFGADNTLTSTPVRPGTRSPLIP